MNAALAALADQQAELLAVVSDLADPDWQQPSRCEAWTVADVVLHLAQTNELASASATGHFAEALDGLVDGLGSAGSVDEGADLMVARERGAPGALVRERWKASATTQLRALAACDPHARVTWVAGQLSAKTLATTRVAETWIHTGDVAAAFGGVPPPTTRLWHVARLAWRTLPYAFARAGRELSGPVAFELRGPNGDAWEFVPDRAPTTVVRGDGAELCLVAARRIDPRNTELRAEGADADTVLELVRTYA